MMCANVRHDPQHSEHLPCALAGSRRSNRSGRFDRSNPERPPWTCAGSWGSLKRHSIAGATSTTKCTEAIEGKFARCGMRTSVSDRSSRTSCSISNEQSKLVAGNDQLRSRTQPESKMSAGNTSFVDRLTAIGGKSRRNRRHAESLLRTGALQTAIFNSANFSSIATDAKGVIQIFNVGAERMLGYTALEVMNVITPAAISDPEELLVRAKVLSAEFGTPITPGFEALVFKASRGIEDIYELTYVKKDKTRLPAMVSVTALRDADDAIIGYLLIGTDNTARKQVEAERVKLEQRLLQKNVELEEASRMKSEFLANMSHELRTPLNAIIGFSEILRDGLIGELTEQQQRFIGDIFSSGNHLLSLINDILDLSKVEAGKMTLELESVEIWSMFANSLSIIREKAAARHIELSMDVPKELGSIQADARKVKQIVYNLLSNAVKFTVDGGEVKLSVSKVARSEVGSVDGSWNHRSFGLPDNDFEQFLRISVCDSGIGISPDGLDGLFNPFSQIDSGLARKYEGTGLGLVLLKNLAELHGGSVAAESEVGKGSRFTVWLPLRPPKSASIRTPTRVPVFGRPNGALGARTALVVEDDFKSADLVRVQLEAEGFEVLHAASAEAALVLAIQQPLALITLDIMLPNMDGWELLSRLKQVPELRRIPVVIISIVAEPSKGFSLGAAAVMQKPISRQELLESLGDLGLLTVSDGKGYKILVVDDDPKAVEVVALRLDAMGSRVLRAYSGQDAIDMARQELPDVIVLDLMMPEISGFDVVAALSETPETAGIPVLVVTAREITDADRARLTGSVAAIMEKGSFNPEDLTSEVRRAMAGRKVSV